MSLSFKAMTYFTAALRHGNIARAAAELNIAASAVSAAIDQVEAAFDLTLVTRQRARGIQPTASGRVVAAKIDRLLEEYRAVMVQGADLRHGAGGTLRIGYYAPIAPAFLPRILDQITADGSGLHLHLDACDNDAAQSGLLDGTYDAILFVSDVAQPAVAFDPLVQAPPYCLLPLSHPLAQLEAVSLAQIAREPMIVLNRPVVSGYYQSLLDAHDLEIAAYANSTEMVRSLVGAGRGCAILNMHPLSTETYAADRVVAVPIADPLPPLTLSVGYDKSRPRRVVADFAAACRAHFGTGGAGLATVVPPPQA
ncbi:LysR family transcriptional regulator [Sulfitobacter sp. S190]|uniref:LysR family transcriptional regulator n=1 Tax=Sulfitobacter sp. S190 TaxID=2867022 RepID=UPI0021A610A1|nr:LysR family transcriptional regulator [Sulfitobacter sp. S190]UWR21723.1 LysR family transcriptional regulator [Sulfitobacter sp. S190]